MNPNAILQEVRQLYNISDRLDVLAENHPLLSEALLGISGSVRKYRYIAGSVDRNEIAPHRGARASKRLTLLISASG